MSIDMKCICVQPDGIKKINELTDYLKVIADANRLKILCLLKDGERCVCDIYEPLALPQNLISHHLKVLKEAGLVLSRKQGKWVHYRINESKLINLNSLYLTLLEKSPEAINSDKETKQECK
jgi:ArsR family transcriptional regulator